MPNMPVSVVCDSKCSVAIRDSLSSSQSSTSGLNNNGGINGQFLSKRVQLDKIEYEESALSYRNTLNDSLKSKYTVLHEENPPGPSCDKNVNGGKCCSSKILFFFLSRCPPENSAISTVCFDLKITSNTIVDSNQNGDY